MFSPADDGADFFAFSDFLMRPEVRETAPVGVSPGLSRGAGDLDLEPDSMRTIKSVRPANMRSPFFKAASVTSSSFSLVPLRLLRSRRRQPSAPHSTAKGAPDMKLSAIGLVALGVRPMLTVSPGLASICLPFKGPELTSRTSRIVYPPMITVG